MNGVTPEPNLAVAVPLAAATAGSFAAVFAEDISAASETVVSSGRLSGVKNWKTVEHICLIASVKSNKCFNTPGNHSAWKKIAEELSTGRTPSTICDHFKEMVSKVRSAISVASVEQNFLPMHVDSENEEEFNNRRRRYVQDLLTSQAPKKALGTSAWWDADVLYELLVLMKTYDEEKGTSSAQNPEQIKAASDNKKRKFAEEQKAKQDEVKKRREEEARERDEDKHMKAEMINNDKLKLEQATVMNQTIKGLAQTLERAIAPSTNDDAINSRLDALEASNKSLDDKLNLIISKLSQN